jgi:hypothetical protein
VSALLVLVLVVQILGFGCLWRCLAALPAAFQRSSDREQRAAASAERVLREAIASKAHTCLAELILHQTRLEAIAAARVADAEARARSKDIQARDTAAALEAACELVRALRAVLDAWGGKRTGPALPALTPNAGSAPERETRRSLLAGAPTPRTQTVLPPERADAGRCS